MVRTAEQGTPLTDLEKTFLREIGKCKSNQEMAAHFKLSTRTVEAHKVTLIHKLGLPSSRHLLVYASRRLAANRGNKQK